MDIKKAYNDLKSTRNLVLLDDESLLYSQKPIGQALLQSKKLGRPAKREEDKANPTDRIECDVCGKVFFRSGRYNHNKTKVHQLYMKMNNKLRKILVND